MVTHNNLTRQIMSKIFDMILTGANDLGRALRGEPRVMHTKFGDLLLADNSKRKQVKFGGYNHTLAAENGDLWDMENLTSDFYPLLSPRTRRWTCRTLTKPNGL